MARLPIHPVRQPHRSGQPLVVSVTFVARADVVALETAVGQSAATLALTAQTRIVLGTATGQSTTAIVLSVTGGSHGPYGIGTYGTATYGETGVVLVLGPSTAQSGGTLTLTAPGVYGAGKFVLRNAVVLVAGFDVSSRSRMVTVTQSRGEIDITGYGDTYRVFMPGESSSTFVVEMFADPEALTPDLWSALKAGVVPVQVVSGPGSPTWMANALMVQGSSLKGQVGDAAKATFELHSTGEVIES